MNTNLLNKKQYDIIATENGWIAQSKENWEKEHKCIIIESVKFGWFVGFGYWKDVYKYPFNGYTHNILLPFVRIQTGLLRVVDKQRTTIKVLPKLGNWQYQS